MTAPSTRFREKIGPQMADIRFFQDFHARVLAEFPMELSVSHVDGKDFLGAVLQKAIRETSGGSPHVHKNPVFHFHLKIFQRRIEFDAAATDKRKGNIFYGDNRGRWKSVPGLFGLYPVHRNETGHDQGPGLFATFGQPVFHQKTV